MSYTNQTQHYGLPQYVATDIPAWLTDVNQAMATIDQGMNAAKTQAESAATAAGQAANDIAALQSTVNTQATQISAAAQAASGAQTTANSADGKADTNAQNITGLDTRVTALEESGASVFQTRAFTISNANYVEIEEVSGHVPVAAISETGNGLAAVVRSGSSSTGYIVRMLSITSSAVTPAAAGNFSGRVFYVPA